MPSKQEFEGTVSGLSREAQEIANSYKSQAGGINAQFAKLNSQGAQVAIRSNDFEKYKLHTQIQSKTSVQTGMSNIQFAVQSTEGASQAQKLMAFDILIQVGFKPKEIFNLANYNDSNNMTDNVTRELAMQNMHALQQLIANLNELLKSENDPKNKKKLQEATAYLEKNSGRIEEGSFSAKEKDEISDKIDGILKMKLSMPVLDMMQNQVGLAMLHDHTTFGGVVPGKRQNA